MNIRNNFMAFKYDGISPQGYNYHDGITGDRGSKFRLFRITHIKVLLTFSCCVLKCSLDFEKPLFYGKYCSLLWKYKNT